MLSSQNKTKVGLKVVISPVHSIEALRQNKTKVGLKGILFYSDENALQSQNKTKVGLKAGYVEVVYAPSSVLSE